MSIFLTYNKHVCLMTSFMLAKFQFKKLKILVIFVPFLKRSTQTGFFHVPQIIKYPVNPY